MDRRTFLKAAVAGAVAAVFAPVPTVKASGWTPGPDDPYIPYDQVDAYWKAVRLRALSERYPAQWVEHHGQYEGWATKVIGIDHPGWSDTKLSA
jgi:hypothetical protein